MASSLLTVDTFGRLRRSAASTPHAEAPWKALVLEEAPPPVPLVSNARAARQARANTRRNDPRRGQPSVGLRTVLQQDSVKAATRMLYEDLWQQLQAHAKRKRLSVALNHIDTTLVNWMECSFMDGHAATKGS